MKCNICDATLNEPKFNEDIDNYDPCDTCMEVIEDTLAGYTDKPSAAEDELGADPDASVWAYLDKFHPANDDFT